MYWIFNSIRSHMGTEVENDLPLINYFQTLYSENWGWSLYDVGIAAKMTKHGECLTDDTWHHNICFDDKVEKMRNRANTGNIGRKEARGQRHSRPPQTSHIAEVIICNHSGCSYRGAGWGGDGAEPPPFDLTQSSDWPWTCNDPR